MKLQTESGVIMTTRADVNARNVFQINYFVCTTRQGKIMVILVMMIGRIVCT